MLGVTLVVFIVSIAAVIAARHNFAGTWKTTWGDLVLTQEGDAVRGNYGSGEKAGSIRGAVSGPRLSFSWREGRKRGRGYFDMVYDGKNVLIEGRWGNGDSDTNGGAWKGHKEGGTFENTTQGGDPSPDTDTRAPLSKPVLPCGTSKCIRCPRPNIDPLMPVNKWMAIMGNSDGPNSAMFINASNGVLYDVEYPAEFIKNGHYPCWQRCFTFEGSGVLKVFTPDGRETRYIPWKIFDVGMRTYIFGPVDGHRQKWSYLDYPGWAPNGETDLTQRCTCK